MTDAEQKAVERVNDARRRNFLPVLSAQTITGSVSFPALRYAIEDHERFRKEVSDAAEHLCRFYGVRIVTDKLERFIITKPDPLAEALNDMKDGRAGPTTESYAACLRAALAKRGGRIVFDD